MVNALTPEQSRAARGWLGWSQAQLAERAHLSLRTLQAFEKGEKRPIANNIAAIRAAIEKAGIRLLFDEHGQAAGVARSDTEGELTNTRRRSRR
jgi:transcriptional regulator with XRE-family HTH domain